MNSIEQLQVKFNPSDSGLYLNYQQGNNLIKLALLAVNSSSQQSPQQKLLIEFNIRDTVEEEKVWSPLQFKLCDVYQSIVFGSQSPGCLLKVNIFVLTCDKNIETAIFNAVFVGLAKMGLPMHCTTYAVSSQSSSHKDRESFIVLDVSGESGLPIYGKCGDAPIMDEQLEEQIKYFKKFLITCINREIN